MRWRICLLNLPVVRPYYLANVQDDREHNSKQRTKYKKPILTVMGLKFKKIFNDKHGYLQQDLSSCIGGQGTLP